MKILTAAQLNKLVAPRGEWMTVIVQPNRGAGIDQWIVNYIKPELDGYCEFCNTAALGALGIAGLGEWEDAGHISLEDGEALCDVARTFDQSASVGFIYWRNC